MSPRAGPYSPGMDAADGTLAILHYNGRHLLEGLLPTVATQTARGSAINVVDNGSSDDSVVWLRGGGRT